MQVAASILTALTPVAAYFGLWFVFALRVVQVIIIISIIINIIIISIIILLWRLVPFIIVINPPPQQAITILEPNSVPIINHQ